MPIHKKLTISKDLELMQSSLNRTEISVVVLIGTLLICLVALAGQSHRASEDTVARAFESAEILAELFRLTQEHYTESISGVEGVAFTLDPEANPGKLMYPATLGRRYSESFNRNHPDTQFKMYSDYPFVTSLDREIDDFGRRALDQLSADNLAPMREVEIFEDGSRRIRLAVPIVMQEGCVACHNAKQWELIRRDWQVGDVRGVREVLITLAPLGLYTQTEASLLLILMFAASLLGIFVVYPAVRREVRNRVLFHELSLKAEAEALKNLEAANTDALTQIGNRRFFDEEFASIAKRYAKGPGRLALMMLDIDHFKQINDRFGHAAGDHVIASLAKILKNYTRHDDKIARLGGEEFVILLADRDPESVQAMTERIRHTVEEHDFDHGGHNIRLTISIGATLSNQGETPCAFLKRADRLLYRAKETGRNKVCLDFGDQSDVALAG